MKIGIAGYGYVGKAIAESMKDKYEVLINDPALGHKASFKEVQALIVCVSTPRSSAGYCVMDNVYQVIEKASNEIPILIKSTISLEGWRMLKDTFPEKEITFSPEFLTAANANSDFANTQQILLGGDNTQFWSGFFVDLLGTVDVKIADPEDLVIAKYVRNSYLALKVTYFNQLYDFCEKAGVDFEQVRKYVADDSRIGYSHTNVTKERGFGGHCFPKDVDAFLHQAKGYNTELSLLEEAVKYNMKIRNEN